MTRLIISLLLIVTLCIPGCKPDVHNPRVEAINVYRDALDQIIAEYLLVRCVSEPYPGFSEKVYNDYRHRKIDSTRYSQIWDSLFTARKSQLPKCVMAYTTLFGASLYTSDSDLRCSMSDALHDDVYYSHFHNARVYSVIDTLMNSTTYDWNEISPPYMDFVKYDSSGYQRPFYTNDTTIIALSGIYFNEATDYAIMYFEFIGGHQYQRGELLFLQKTSGYWKAIGFRTIWIT